jgi:hypothetical protein
MVINHYAMPQEYEMRVRNNKMAQYLMSNGHSVKIIAASTLHNTDIDLMEKTKAKVMEKNMGTWNLYILRLQNTKVIPCQE